MEAFADHPPQHMVRTGERVAAIARRASRRPNHRDRQRVARYVELLDEGLDEVEAAWRVLADERLGIRRWRGAPVSARPRDVAVLQRVAALLQRALPAVADELRHKALARIAGLTGKAVQTLDEVVGGDFDDPAHARVRLEGARAVLDVVQQECGATPAVAVQVNLGPSPYELADALSRDAELRERAIDLARQIDAVGAEPGA